MKKRLALTLVAPLIFSLPLFCQAPPVGNYDVLILLGQSNAVGEGCTPEAKSCNGQGTDNAKDAAEVPYLWQWDNDHKRIIPAIDPIWCNGFGTRGTVGPGMTLGKTYYAGAGRRRNILLVCTAKGGSSFYEHQWQAPSGDLVADTETFYSEALQAAGEGSHIVGIVWDQGETDVERYNQANYGYDLASLVRYLRSTLATATWSTPWVTVGFAPEWEAYNDNFPAAKKAQTGILSDLTDLDAYVGCAAFADSSGTTSNPPDTIGDNGVHFDALSQRTMGQREARALLALIPHC